MPEHLTAAVQRHGISQFKNSPVESEAVLKLRALISNGDFEDYWHWHLAQEHQQVHKARYNNGVIPTR